MFDNNLFPRCENHDPQFLRRLCDCHFPFMLQISETPELLVGQEAVCVVALLSCVLANGWMAD